MCHSLLTNVAHCIISHYTEINDRCLFIHVLIQPSKKMRWMSVDILPGHFWTTSNGQRATVFVSDCSMWTFVTLSWDVQYTSLDRNMQRSSRNTEEHLTKSDWRKYKHVYVYRLVKKKKRSSWTQGSHNHGWFNHKQTKSFHNKKIILSTFFQYVIVKMQKK